MNQAAKAAPVLRDKEIFCRLLKVDAAKREVWGVVTAEQPDRENEICDYDTTVPYYKEVVDEMSKATSGANIFPLRAMHGLIAAGKGISIEFRKEAKEIYMGFKVVDDVEWKKCEEGVYTGFSQGGAYVKRWKDGDYTRYTARPGEVSLVDIPCLQTAHFDYVKADGTVEMRKFTTSTTPQPNPEPKEKAVKYLVEEGGKQYLPYTKADGTPDLRLMRAAWNQLFEVRGKTYGGPNKEAAIKRLKQLYAAAGLDNPAEKSTRIEGLLKGILESTINSRAYGYLGKGMYNISRFAQIIEDLKYLWIGLEYERADEEDSSPATDDLKELFTSLLANFLVYAEEQVAELTAHAAEFEVGGLAMSTKAVDLLKAALGKDDDMAMAAYFKASADVHKGMAEDHEKMATAHKAHSECHDGLMGKAADGAKEYHKTSSEYHKAMSGHHSEVSKRHASHAADLDKAAKDADEAADKKKKDKDAADKAEEEKNKKVSKSGADMSDPNTAQPVAPAGAQPTPATGAAPVAPAATPESDLSKTLDKSLDDRLGKAIGEAIDRVLASSEFSKTLDEKLAGKMLEKLGGTTAPTKVSTFAIPRAGEGNPGVVKSGATQPINAPDGKAPDPQFAGLCSIESR